jgi:hypothetical protein
LEMCSSIFPLWYTLYGSHWGSLWASVLLSKFNNEIISVPVWNTLIPVLKSQPWTLKSTI